MEATLATAPPQPGQHDELTAQLGWLAAAAPDAPLVLRAAERLAGTRATAPAAWALARLLLVRSARCRRLAGAYLDRARGLLTLQRQAHPSRWVLPFWLALVYLARHQPAEADRELRAAMRLLADAAGMETATDDLAPEAVATARAAVARMLRPVPPDIAGGNVAAGTGSGCLELAGGAIPEKAPSRQLIVSAPDGRPIQVVVEGQGVSLPGVALPALEGEFLLALLGWHWMHREAMRHPWMPRSRWVRSVWPVAEHPVGRLHGLFFGAIRTLRLRLRSDPERGDSWIVAGPEGYRLADDVSWRLRLGEGSMAAWIGGLAPAGAEAAGVAGAGDLPSRSEAPPETERRRHAASDVVG